MQTMSVFWTKEKIVRDYSHYSWCWCLMENPNTTWCGLGLYWWGNQVNVSICQENNLVRRYIESLALQNGDPTLHWDYNKTLYLMMKLKELHLESNKLIFQCDLFNNSLTMVSLFQMMRSLVLCRHIFVPNHAWVQISFGLLNGLMACALTRLVILNSINLWSYVNFFVT